MQYLKKYVYKKKGRIYYRILLKLIWREDIILFANHVAMQIIKHKIVSISAKVDTPLNNVLAIGYCSRLPFCISLLNAYIPNLS